jgi:hypothetical protein
LPSAEKDLDRTEASQARRDRGQAAANSPRPVLTFIAHGTLTAKLSVWGYDCSSKSRWSRAPDAHRLRQLALAVSTPANINLREAEAMGYRVAIMPSLVLAAVMDVYDAELAALMSSDQPRSERRGMSGAGSRPKRHATVLPGRKLRAMLPAA